MKCSKCGAELTDDTKFCSYCGAKVENNTEMPSIPQTEDRNGGTNADVEIDNSVYTEPVAPRKKESKSNKVKETILKYWNKSSKSEMLAVTGVALFAVFGAIAFLAGRIVSGIFSIIQIAIVVIVILMKRNIIKVPKNWIPIAALATSFALIIPYFGLFKINSADYVKYDWDGVVLAEMLPEPESPYGKIISNSEDYLSLDVTKTSEEQYKDYIEACKNKGFAIDTEVTGGSFCAYNDKGYKLSLSYYDYNSEMHINLDSAMEMETITWPDSGMAKLLPVPKSTTGKIYSNDEDGFSVYIGNTTIDDYNDYVKACEEKGFTVDAQKKDKTFSAKNADSYKLTVDYKGNNIVYISIAEPEFNITIEVECVGNWLLSKYDVELSIDDELEGTIPHGDNKTFNVVLKRGKHKISFESVEDDTLDGEVEVEITKNETIKLRISCSSFGVDVDVISGTISTDNNETMESTKNAKSELTKIEMTDKSDAYKGMDKSEVAKIFKDMGFTDVGFVEVITEDTTVSSGSVTTVKANSRFFEKGDAFSSDTKIEIVYLQYKKPDSEYEKAFVRKLNNYSLYYMFDTDTKQVVTFGTQDTYVDKGTYSGDFNSGVTIKWNHGEWTEKFSQPDGSSYATLTDGNGFDWPYKVCDIMDAQKILNELQ